MEITQMNHRSHRHPLQLKPPGAPYMCSGCRELGFGSSYRCEKSDCNFILHEECASAVSPAFHRFFKRCNFEFYEEAPGYRTRYCDACGRDVLGFVYHCSRTGYDLHPCCLRLKDSVSEKGGHVTLELCQKVPSKCLKCKSKNVVKGLKGWSYASAGGDYCYHVSCVKELILENWKRDYFSQETNSIQMRDQEYQVVPTSVDMLQSGRSSVTRTMRKYRKIATVVFELIFSAIFGNPVSAIVALVGALVSD